jgi:two-component sensor histidine kinase
MVDMPHIRFGDESSGYEFPIVDGSSGQVLATNGAGQLVWTDADLSGGGIWMRSGYSVYLSTSADSVGIGISDPTEKLDVDGNIRARGLLVEDAIDFDGLTAEIAADSELVVSVPSGLLINGENQGVPVSSGRLINTSTGAYLSGDGIWVDACDPDDFQTLSGLAQDSVLEKLAGLPINRWETDGVDGMTHIGPISPDVLALFGVGDGKSVSSYDLAGIALAAIKELHSTSQAHQQQLEQIAVLQNQVNELEQIKAQLEELQARVQTLSAVQE